MKYAGTKTLFFLRRKSWFPLKYTPSFSVAPSAFSASSTSWAHSIKKITRLLTSKGPLLTIKPFSMTSMEVKRSKLCWGKLFSSWRILSFTRIWELESEEVSCSMDLLEPEKLCLRGHLPPKPDASSSESLLHSSNSCTWEWAQKEFDSSSKQQENFLKAASSSSTKSTL